MTENRNRLNELLEKYSSAEINEPEFNELCNLINDPQNDASLKELLVQDLANGSFTEMNKGQLDVMLAKVLTSPPAPLQREMGASVLRLWRRVAAAAAIILFISVGGYFIFKNSRADKLIGTTQPQEKRFKNDVAAPANSKAFITLADGRTVALDSLTSGTLATQGHVNVTKTIDGKIVYDGSSKEIAFNTLSNPRGSKVINLTLADGSRAWLNAESSLRYPTAFAGKERKVELTGEGYFEVAHNARQTFIVTANGTEIHDIGTHFNVNAYSDEVAMKVTLLEGSVQIESVILKPNQQAIVGAQLKVINDVDVMQTIAWQKGLFEFDNTDLVTIMRQISRWYDVDVVYETKPGDAKFFGGISKNLPLSNVLKLIEANGVRFKLEGKNLKVIP